MRKYIVGVIILLFVFSSMSFGGSKELSRAEAAKKLSNIKLSPVTCRYKNYYGPAFHNLPSGDPELNKIEEELKMLKRDGYIEYNRVSTKNAYNITERIDVTPTEKLIPYITNMDDKTTSTMNIKVADIVFDKVTGIRDFPQLGGKAVNYTTKPIHTPMADIFCVKDKNKYGIKNMEALFVLYDDGWRIQK